MEIKFSEIYELFEFVNFGAPQENEGYICKSTGKTYFYSVYGNNEEELPNDIDDKKYLVIPYKNELDLGRNLAFDFIQENLSSKYDEVSTIFQKKGAYSRFKSLLQNSGKIEEWYEFESKRTEKALREWCNEQNINISG